jgi:multiple sugar transport system permease protein
MSGSSTVPAHLVETRPAPAEAASRFAGQTKWFPWLLFGPTILYLLVLSIFPLIYSIGVSLFNYTLGGNATFIGLQNYRDLLTDEVFWRKTWTTLQITITAVGIQLSLGLICALVLNRRLPGMGPLRLIIYLPMMMSPLVIGYFWKFILDGSFGVLNYLVSFLGIPPQQWTIDLTLAKASIVLVDVWQWTPFVILILLAGLQSVPPQLYEAATLDRASAWMQFTRITLPYLKIPILLALLFRTIDTFKIFDIVYVVTAGGPGDLTETLSVFAFYEGFKFSQLGRAAAISWLVVIVINILATILIKMLTRPRAKAVLDQEGAVA